MIKCLNRIFKLSLLFQERHDDRKLHVSDYIAAESFGYIGIESKEFFKKSWIAVD